MYKCKETRLDNRLHQMNLPEIKNFVLYGLFYCINLQVFVKLVYNTILGYVAGICVVARKLSTASAHFVTPVRVHRHHRTGLLHLRR